MTKPQGLDTAQWHEMVRKKRDEERKENGFPLFLSRDEWEILIREKVEEARKQGMPYWIPREVRDRLFGTDFVGTYLPIKNQEARGSSVPGK